MLISLMWWVRIISIFLRETSEMNHEIYFRIMIFVFQIMIAILSLLLQQKGSRSFRTHPLEKVVLVTRPFPYSHTFRTFYIISYVFLA